MGITEGLVAKYESLLKELELTGPDPRWVAKRQLTNVILKACEAQIDYERGKVEDGAYIEFMETGETVTDEDRANVKQAIELRKYLYRRLKEIKKSMR